MPRMTKQGCVKNLSYALVMFFPWFCVFAVDNAAPPTLEAGYRQMYNFNLPGAHATFRKWEQLHPDDPMGPASDAAAYLFSELDRLHILESDFFADDDKIR